MKPTAYAAVLSTAMFLLPGCAQRAVVEERPRPAVQVLPEPEWVAKIMTRDEERIRRVHEAWNAALAEARSQGYRKAITREGRLLAPDAALARPEPPPGPYRCRMLKIGTQGRGGRAFHAYNPFFCYVEAFGDDLAITKQTGSQRPAGYLYPDEDRRHMIFLGSVALGDEKEPLPYGEREDRDMVGIVERIGPFHYRLVIPWPRSESKLDVIELVPVVQ